MENIGLAHQRPLLWIAACFAAGAAGAGADSRSVGRAIVIAAIVSAALGAAAGALKAAPRSEPGGNASGGYGSMFGACAGARVRACAFGLAAALSALAGYARCGAVLSERASDYAPLDGQDVALICEIKSGVEWKEDGRLLVEAAPIGFAGERQELGERSDGRARGDGALGGHELSESALGGRVLLSVEAGAESPVDWGAAAEEKLRGALSYGARVEARGKLRKPTRSQNKGLFDYSRYLYSRGLSATVNADIDGVTAYTDGDAGVDSGCVSVDSGCVGDNAGGVSGGGAAPSLIGLGLLARERAQKALYAALPARDAALLTGVALGKDDGVDQATREGFAAAGLLHLLAVSGTHVGIAAGAAAFVAGKAGAGSRAAGVLSLVCVTGFAFVAGFSASVVRACVVYAAATAAKLTNRGYDGMSALGLAAIILLVCNPAQIFSAGFALSFACAMSIVVISPAVRAATRRVRLPEALKGQFAVAAAVSAGVTPLLVNLFHSLPLLSIPANILASPIIAATLCMAQLSALAGAVFAPLGFVPAALAESCVCVLRAVMSAASSAPSWLTPRPGSFGAPLMIAWYAALIAFAVNASKVSSHRRKILSNVSACAAGLTALVFAIGGSVAAGSRMEIVFLDVGNANAAYIEIEGRRSVIVDAGGPSWGGLSWRDPAGGETEPPPGLGERRLSDYLIARGVRDIDVAIVTHGDADHISGFYAVLDNVRINTLLMPYAGGREDEESLTALADRARACGATVEEVGAGDIFILSDNSYVEAISPPRPTSDHIEGVSAGLGSDANDLSLVVGVSFGESRALFCGDISADAENAIIASGQSVDADVLSTPHHGSKYSNSIEFVKAVSPVVAVTGTGRNSYGHPSPAIAERYEAQGAAFLRTDRDGMTTVYCSPDGAVDFSCYNDSNIRLKTTNKEQQMS